MSNRAESSMGGDVHELDPSANCHLGWNYREDPLFNNVHYLRWMFSGGLDLDPLVNLLCA